MLNETELQRLFSAQEKRDLRDFTFHEIMLQVTGKKLIDDLVSEDLPKLIDAMEAFDE